MAASGFTPVCNRFLPRNPTSARQHHPPIRPSRHQAPLDLPALAPRQGLCSGRFMPRAEPNGSEAGICGVLRKYNSARTFSKLAPSHKDATIDAAISHAADDNNIALSCHGPRPPTPQEPGQRLRFRSFLRAGGRPSKRLDDFGCRIPVVSRVRVLTFLSVRTNFHNHSNYLTNYLIDFSNIS